MVVDAERAPLPGLCQPCGSKAATPLPGSGSTGEKFGVSNHSPLTPRALSVLGSDRLPSQYHVCGVVRSCVPNSSVKLVSFS